MRYMGTYHIIDRIFGGMMYIIINYSQPDVTSFAYVFVHSADSLHLYMCVHFYILN